MEEFTALILKNAVIKEQVAQKLYLELGKKAKSEKIRKLFYRLAEEEILHEQLFSKMDLSVINKVNNGYLKDLHLISDQKEDLMGNDIAEINKALDFAIDEEQKAYEDYSKLINFLEFGEARDALEKISKQELNHRTMLQKVKLQFNKDDWSSIKIPED
jgi:rubrerythrin